MCDVLQTRTWPLDKAGHEGVTTFYSRQGRAWGCDDRLGRVVDKGVTNHYSRQAWAWGRDERVGRVADGPAVLRRRAAIFKDWATANYTTGVPDSCCKVDIILYLQRVPHLGDQDGYKNGFDMFSVMLYCCAFD